MEGKTEKQKAFLGQTQYSKFLMRYISSIGGSDKIYDLLTADTAAENYWKAGPEKEYAIDEDDPSAMGAASGGMRNYKLPWMTQDGDKSLPDFIYDELSETQQADVDAMSTQMWGYWNDNVGTKFDAIPSTVTETDDPHPKSWFS